MPWWWLGLALAASLAVMWAQGSRMAAGIAAGAAWNIVSLWCLSRLLAAWLGPKPSRRRAIGWLLIKFPLLYLVIVAAFRAPSLSIVGFGVGFTAVLLAAMGRLALRMRHLTCQRGCRPAERGGGGSSEPRMLRSAKQSVRGEDTAEGEAATPDALLRLASQSEASGGAPEGKTSGFPSELTPTRAYGR